MLVPTAPKGPPMDCCSPDVDKGRLLPTTPLRVLSVEPVEVPARMPAHEESSTPASDHICRGRHQKRTGVSRHSEGNRKIPPFLYYSNVETKGNKYTTTINRRNVRAGRFGKLFQADKWRKIHAASPPLNIGDNRSSLVPIPNMRLAR
jgi:hypothetical protein